MQHDTWTQYFRLAGVFFSALLIALIFDVSAYAQASDIGWTTPNLIFAVPQDENSNEQWLLRDPADRLYVWWPVFTWDEQTTPGTRDAIFHSQWDGNTWATPRDVLVSPAAAGLLNVVVDSDGTLHGFSASGCVSYVHVRHDQAMDPKAWSQRTCIDSIGNANVAAAIGPDDTLYVAFVAPGTQQMRIAQSRDGGRTWLISNVASVQDVVDVNWDFVEQETSSAGAYGFFSDPALVVDELGRLHLVWSPASPPVGYPLLGVLYSRSDDGGSTWSHPSQLGREKEGQPALAVYQDEVHVLWNGDAGKAGRYYRYSGDAGAGWEPIVALLDEGSPGGLQRPPALAVDSLGRVHALIHSQQHLYYMFKDRAGWSPREALYIPEELNAREVFTVRAAIIGGNQLHAVYTISANENGQKSLYHQLRMIDAPSSTPSPWPTGEGLVSDTEDRMPSLAAVPDKDPLFHYPNRTSPFSFSALPVTKSRVLPGSSLLWSTLFSCIMIGLFLLIINVQRRR